MGSTDDRNIFRLDSEIDPWERQPGETIKKYGQFCAYRDQGRTRTIRKTSENLTLQTTYMRTVAAKNLWRERAEAWDRYRDRLHQQSWVEERRKAAENDAKLLNVAIAKASRYILDTPLSQFTPREAVHLFDVALKHRRTLFGDPQQTIAVTGPGGDPLTLRVTEFEQMPAERRRAEIAELVEQVARRERAISGDVDD